MAAPGVFNFDNFSGKQLSKSLMFSNLVTISLMGILTFMPKVIYGSTLLFQDRMFAIKAYILVLAICQVMFLKLKVKYNSTSWTFHVKPIMKTAFVVLSSVVVLHIFAVLFGAALTESVSETFHFASLLAVVTALPCCCMIGTNVDDWIRLFTLNSAVNVLESQVYITTVCSLLGAWLGAIPIPLDWDRWWQEWPITCVSGTLLGYENGLLITSFLVLYNSWKQRKSKLI